MFTVIFRNWNNNHSEFDTPETYDNLDQAKYRADLFYSLVVDDMGNNCYNQNGCETWVENEQGQRIYDGVQKNAIECPFI